MKKADKTRLRVFLMLLAYVFLLCLLIFFIKFRSRNKKIIFGSTYMTMNNPYFNVLNENLRDTIEANGDILITRDPAQSQSRQNAQIIDMLNEGIDILFANAVDRSGIESALYECKKRGVPVILLDTDVDDRVGVISTIQSDNYQAGVLLANDLLKKKPEGAKILIVANLIASSMVQRRQGFIDTIKNKPEYEIVDEIDGVSEIETVNEAMNKYLRSNSKEIDVIFGMNDPTAIGKEAARTAYDYLNKKNIESDIYIGVDLINAGNITKFDISKWQ